jgi:hypothetical protein
VDPYYDMRGHSLVDSKAAGDPWCEDPHGNAHTELTNMGYALKILFLA